MKTGVPYIFQTRLKKTAPTKTIRPNPSAKHDPMVILSLSMFHKQRLVWLIFPTEIPLFHEQSLFHVKPSGIYFEEVLLSIQKLSRTCPEAIQKLSSYPEAIQNLCRSYPDAIQKLSRNYPEAIQELSRFSLATLAHSWAPEARGTRPGGPGRTGPEQRSPNTEQAFTEQGEHEQRTEHEHEHEQRTQTWTRT